MSSVYELCLFMTMLGNYEPGIVDMIFKFMKSYTFKRNEELYEGVNLWCGNREEAIQKYGHISYWDVSHITDMSQLFSNNTKFNDDISCWDVRHVTKMYYMFANAKSFNQPIGDWNVTHVIDMSSMFNHANKFNKPIGNWDVSNVTRMEQMFNCAIKFNQPLGNWDISNVTKTKYMFYNTGSFEFKNRPVKK